MYDLFVIGGGSGGVRAARMAAQRGARVGLAESQGVAGLGGTCVNVGCIPKKLYSYAAHHSHGFTESAGFGWESLPPTFNWATLQANRRREISRLNGVYAQLLAGTGVQVFHAHARLTGPNTVEITTQGPGGPAVEQVEARHILLATGGWPTVPDLPGRHLAITSNEIFDLAPFPRRLVVVGGGYIASEFASIFQGLGSAVTQIHRGDQILRGFDADVRQFVSAEMVKHGVDLRLRSDVAALRQTEGGIEVALRDGGTLLADAVLYATGRAPNVEHLGLAQAGVAQDARGAVQVDDHFRSSVPSIWAVGDVIHKVQLTPVALAEAMVVVDQILGPPPGRAPRAMDYALIPTAVFTLPNVATVGLTEEQARAQFAAIRVYRSEFKALKHALSGSSERTLMKMLVDDASDRVVGMHMVGADAGEIIQGFAVAMKAGATKAEFDTTIGIHPTAAEEFVTMREPVAG